MRSFVLCTLQKILKLRRKGLVRHAARMGETNVYEILVGKPEVNKPLGRPGSRWQDNT
jgi:hypothetical protein